MCFESIGLSSYFRYFVYIGNPIYSRTVISSSLRPCASARVLFPQTPVPWFEYKIGILLANMENCLLTDRSSCDMLLYID